MSNRTNNHSKNQERRQKPIRVKHVSNAEEVAHWFANQRNLGVDMSGIPFVDDGRTSSDNFSFSGDRCWSYSTVIAKRYDDIGIVLISEERYSNTTTTSRHLSNIRSAFRGHDMRLVTVPYVDPSNNEEHWGNLAKLRRDIGEALSEMRNSRYRPWHSASWERIVERMEIWLSYARAFRLTKWFGKAEKEIARILDGKREFDSVTLDSVPLCSDERDEAIIKKILSSAPSEREDTLRVLFGFADRDDVDGNPDEYLSETQLFERFQIEVAYRHKTEVCLREYLEAKERGEDEFRRKQSSESYNRWSKMSEEERIESWKHGDIRPNSYTMRLARYLPCGLRPVATSYGVYSPDRQPGVASQSIGRRSEVFRYLPEKGEYETSQSVKVSRLEGIRAYRLLRRLWECRRNPVEFYKQRERILKVFSERKIGRAFAIDSVDENGWVKAGCHTFHWDEISQIAFESGVADSLERWEQPALPAPSAN